MKIDIKDDIRDLSLNKTNMLTILFIALIIMGAPGSPIKAQAIDVSDAAVQEFLKWPFQYDYTSITDDSTLRRFIDALDYQLAMIEYRQRREFTAEAGSPAGRQSFKGELEERYRELMRDGFIYRKLKDWRPNTTDSVNRSFIDLFISRHDEFTADPSSIRQARELSQRIANRLYNFQLEVDRQKYKADAAARIIYGDGDIELARKLHRLVNDSAATLVPEADKLYNMYRAMGQQRGQRTSQDYFISRLSYRKPEWLRIANDLKAATEAEYGACLDFLKKETGQENLPLFEIERHLIEGAILPDSCFPPDKIESAMAKLTENLGLGDMMDKLTVRIDSSSFPALAIRLYPPYDDLLLKNNRGGFSNYRRLAGETGRAMLWVYADSSLPYLLRDYPFGSEEILTELFQRLALKPAFLSANFSISPEDMKRFEKYYRWQTVSVIRRVLLYFNFDYYLSNDLADDPARVYMSLEDSLFATHDSSYQWIEMLLTGGLESYPEKLANIFADLKNVEILRTQIGQEYALSPSTGKFLIDNFCRPGRSQTIEQYITAHASDRLSIKDLKRQLNLH